MKILCRSLPVLAALLSSACGEASREAMTPPGGASFRAELPTGIATLKRRGLSPSARLYIDRRPPLSLDIDADLDQALGEINAISNGSHRFELRFDLPSGNGEALPLASGSRHWTVTDRRQISPTYDWTLMDRDQDGYSTLQELLAGTHWDNPGHHPDANPRLSSHYRLRDVGTGIGYPLAPGRSGGGAYEIH